MSEHIDETGQKTVIIDTSNCDNLRTGTWWIEKGRQSVAFEKALVLWQGKFEYEKDENHPNGVEFKVTSLFPTDFLFLGESYLAELAGIDHSKLMNEIFNESKK